MESMSELGIDLFSSQPSLELIEQVTLCAHSSAIELQKFSDQVLANQEASTPEDLLRVGIGLHITGQSLDAIEKLQGAKNSLEKYMVLGFAQRACKKYEDALVSFQKTLDFKADVLVVATERVATMIKACDLEAAQEALDKCSNYEGVSAEYHYQLAQLRKAQGAHGEAEKHAKQALALVPDHTGSLFMLALRADLVGNDDEAIDYYRQIIASSKCSVNVWLNLAILYEDCGDYDKASTCTEAVLTAFPSHPRALLFQKDIDSSKTMFFDEEREKKLSRKNQILETPISDFELSVRSRNCLKKMSILTLGDLLNISEAELLSYKNFGETSLREIKAILDTKGLGLGMALDDKHFAKKAVSEPAHEEDQGLLSKPVDDLQLSVRARKCIQKLNIRTIGDMTRTTDAELLGCKNFGVTSLNEINKALNAVGLSLRSLD
ncbi:MAG: tetratricopeptide repeat protein [Planctomycetes bacterium]|nr:tetratricopeptide repeat protein [Planctomycetota bacterium]